MNFKFDFSFGFPLFELMSARRVFSLRRERLVPPKFTTEANTSIGLTLERVVTLQCLACFYGIYSNINGSSGVLYKDFDLLASCSISQEKPS